jgi:hypothetical protein
MVVMLLTCVAVSTGLEAEAVPALVEHVTVMELIASANEAVPNSFAVS